MKSFYSGRYFNDYYVGLDHFENQTLGYESSKAKIIDSVNKIENKNYTTLDEVRDLINETKVASGDDFENHRLFIVSSKYDQLIINGTNALKVGKARLEKAEIDVKFYGNLLWTVTTSVFVVGK